jgi:hypothetical protein
MTPEQEAKTNMYGCTPCPNPQCKSRYRCVFAKTPRTIDCDDCGGTEQITPDNYVYYNEETGNDP